MALDGMPLPETPTKQAVKDRLRATMLADCDADIRQAFTEHYYTVEPLLMQLIREISMLRRALTHADQYGPATDPVRPAVSATAGNPRVTFAADADETRSQQSGSDSE